MAHPGGRPLLFKTPQDLQKKIDKYFKDCDDTIVRTVYGKDGDVMETITTPYTISGLAYALRTSRETLMNYEERGEYFDTIKDAKQKIVTQQEQRALSGQANPTFSIFSLKNNYAWKDQHDIDHTSKGERITYGFQEVTNAQDNSTHDSTNEDTKE